MAIVSAKDTRNSQWANDKNAFGRKMLSKMGWKGDGSGLGKNQHGTTTNLRAVRRTDSLGIGAENDSFGDKGWQDTNAGFHGVLASLKKEYSNGDDEGGDDSKAARKKRKKEEKKRKKREEKRRAKNSGGSDSDDGILDGVRRPQNRVQAGHARKMREAKDIKNKSAADMAAIFGVKADFYKQPRDWGVVGGGGSSEENNKSSDSEEKKKKKSKKKSKESKESNDEEVVGSAELKKDKKKRKRSSEGSDSEDKKKRKKDKSKK